LLNRGVNPANSGHPAPRPARTLRTDLACGKGDRIGAGVGRGIEAGIGGRGIEAGIGL